MAKNLASKTRPVDRPYEIWQRPGWEWRVLKKSHGDDTNPQQRWFCSVTSPFIDYAELGDVYASEVMANARKVSEDYD